MDDLEKFRWAYGIARSDDLNAPILQYFDTIHAARKELKTLQEAYPDLPLTIFVPGDQLYIQRAAHELIH